MLILMYLKFKCHKVYLLLSQNIRLVLPDIFHRTYFMPSIMLANVRVDADCLKLFMSSYEALFFSSQCHNYKCIISMYLYTHVDTQKNLTVIT